VAGWNVRLANWEALNFSLLDECTLCLLGGALVRTCRSAPHDLGQILTTFGYVQMFQSGVLSLPVLVRQLSRLRDIGRGLLWRPTRQIRSLAGALCGPRYFAASPGRLG
jgi:hypothetical protein